MSRVLLHLSDLHFGRIQAGLPEALLEAARRIAPDLVVVSGDLTQRARIVEFQQARAFLDQLPFPRIVVPGNHDVPLHNLYGRFVHRLSRFQSYITEDLEPVYQDGEVAVFGVNTARSLTWKGGRINSRQIESLRTRLCATRPELARIVVTHHPFEIPQGFHQSDVVGSARAALERWTDCGADLLLCGHLHVGDSTTTLNRYSHVGWHAIVVTAGTAISTRSRGVPNSFNALSVEDRRSVVVAKWSWDVTTHAFQKLSDARFVRTTDGWVQSSDGPV
jgi:3',5'-cyclic AMP phosphodiesterase CpdA